MSVKDSSPKLIMSDKVTILSFIHQQKSPVSMGQIKEHIPFTVTDRTVRRWLNNAANNGDILIHGNKRTTTYLSTKKSRAFKFLQGKPASLQEQTLKLLRDFWTHNSTAIEGNTLTLGDTQFILDEGLTIPGKPIKEHQEIIGHASAIELLYRMLNTGVTANHIYDLHKAIQTDVIFDSYTPYGAWKVEPNGTRTRDLNGKPIYLEYAQPRHVAKLMSEVIHFINTTDQLKTTKSAIHAYAKVHAAIAHIHPFWDGNGRIARLLANIPLLNTGLPPIVIPTDRRQEYIQLLATYELSVGQLTDSTGVWPKEDALKDFEIFCHQCYETTANIIDIG